MKKKQEKDGGDAPKCDCAKDGDDGEEECDGGFSADKKKDAKGPDGKACDCPKKKKPAPVCLVEKCGVCEGPDCHYFPESPIVIDCDEIDCKPITCKGRDCKEDPDCKDDTCVPFVCGPRDRDCEIVIPHTCKECGHTYPCKGGNCNMNP